MPSSRSNWSEYRTLIEKGGEKDIKNIGSKTKGAALPVLQDERQVPFPRPETGDSVLRADVRCIKCFLSCLMPPPPVVSTFVP